MKLVPIAAGLIVAVLAFGSGPILNAGALACGVTQASADRIADKALAAAQPARQPDARSTSVE